MVEFPVAFSNLLRARGEFLVRMANAAETREILMEGARMRQQQADAGRVVDTPAAAAPRPSLESRETLSQTQGGTGIAARPYRRLLDVNRIGERELAMLPGMGPERARQVIALRESSGGFHSFDHFAEKTGLAPEQRERLRALFIQPELPEQSFAEYTVLPDGRRILEVNLASAQAIATLPGFDHDTARSAVALRESDGPYLSVEDFRFRLGLSMETLVMIAPMVSTVKTPALLAGGVKPGGRVVDAHGAAGAGSGGGSQAQRPHRGPVKGLH